MKCKVLFILVLSSLVLLSCDTGDDDQPQPSSGCTANSIDVIIDNNRYAAITDDVSIIDMQINGDCLTVSISASGCDGSTWVLNLIDSDIVSFSNPPQRTLALELENPEACLAVFERDFVFDISDLQEQAVNQMVLTISNAAGMTNNTITYNY